MPWSEEPPYSLGKGALPFIYCNSRLKLALHNSRLCLAIEENLLYLEQIVVVELKVTYMNKFHVFRRINADQRIISSRE